MSLCLSMSSKSLIIKRFTKNSIALYLSVSQFFYFGLTKSCITSLLNCKGGGSEDSHGFVISSRSNKNLNASLPPLEAQCNLSVSLFGLLLKPVGESLSLIKSTYLENTLNVLKYILTSMKTSVVLIQHSLKSWHHMEKRIFIGKWT